MPYNFIGTINQLGYGQVGFNLLKAMTEMNMEPALWPVGPVEIEREHAEIVQKAIQRSYFFDHKKDCVRLYHPFDMAFFAGKGKHIGYTFFETTKLKPIEYHHLSTLDEVVVSCKWAKDILDDNGIMVPIKVANPGVNPEIFNKDVSPMYQSLTKPTVFVNMGKWEYRKGHDFILEAFNKAFIPSDNVTLLMHCFNPLRLNGYDGPAISQEWAHYYMSSPMGQADKIICTTNRFGTQAEVASFLQSADVGLFPARAEGWNLELAEMMAMGKPCIVTNYSAHEEFLNKQWGTIEVDKLEVANDGYFFKGDVGEWAYLGEPQLEQTINYMREAHQRKQEGKAIECDSLKLNWHDTVKILCS